MKALKTTDLAVFWSEPWLNVHQIAKHLGLSKETIYRMIYRDEIPRHRLGKKWLFKASIVDKWIASKNRKCGRKK